jgi:hypothetical protein
MSHPGTIANGKIVISCMNDFVIKIGTQTAIHLSGQTGIHILRFGKDMPRH